MGQKNKGAKNAKIFKKRFFRFLNLALFAS